MKKKNYEALQNRLNLLIRVNEIMKEMAKEPGTTPEKIVRHYDLFIRETIEFIMDDLEADNGMFDRNKFFRGCHGLPNKNI